MGEPSAVQFESAAVTFVLASTVKAVALVLVKLNWNAPLLNVVNGPR